jgi:hypothetical protein
MVTEFLDRIYAYSAQFVGKIYVQRESIYVSKVHPRVLGV